MPDRYLVTGGAGFIGSNFIRYVRTHDPSATIVNLDAMTYAGVWATVKELDGLGNHSFVRGDIRDSELVDKLVQDSDIVVNFAAESHVDRSITDPQSFVQTNVVGTSVLIDSAVRNKTERFLHVSTDEVYGSIESGAAREDASLAPSSPYSASKAAADLLVLSYAETFDYLATITRCTNNFGPYQFPEKLLPLFITRTLDNLRVPLYGDGTNERDWLHVEDHCAAIFLLLKAGKPGGVYNIGADAQRQNIDLTRTVLELMGVAEDRVEYVADRPGHDRRYAVDSSKLRSLGWAPTSQLGNRLEETIDWYRAREDWWRPLIGGKR